MDTPCFRENVLATDVEQIRKAAESTGFFTAAELDVAVELVEERLAKGLDSGYHFLFADNPAGSLLGYTCFGEIPCTIGSYDLYWIVVHKNSQAMGLGHMLMRQTETTVAKLGGRGIYAETSGRSQYAPTRSFYLKNNYTVIATFKDFYAPGDDKIVFFKPLKLLPGSSA